MKAIIPSTPKPKKKVKMLVNTDIITPIMVKNAPISAKVNSNSWIGIAKSFIAASPFVYFS